MDKAIIFGGFEFLGFYLTTALLEKGNMVQCVHFDVNEDSFLEEKRFSVGRNDNFSEIPLSEWAEDSEKKIIIISFFDLFLKKDSNETMTQIERVFEKAMAKEVKEKAFYVFLLPMQYLEIDDHSFLYIRNKIEENNLHYKCIYIPTLFGPWQPMENIFQQAFLYEAGEKENLHLNDKEWVFDTIYVSDAACEILNVIESGTTNSCILKSDVKDHWKKCAEFLSIHSSEYEDAFYKRINVKDIPFTVVPESIGYIQGLNHQKRHLLRILSGV